LTFITDLDDLIRHHHGDIKKLREIRDTVRHDNFITTEDKNYVESLITIHLKNQPLDKSLPHKRPDTKIKLQSKPTPSSLDSARVVIQQQIGSSTFSSNKKLGVIAGVAAAIAIIVIVGFTATDFTSNSILSKSLLVNVDQTTYQRADIISITGNTITNAKSVQLTIENTDAEACADIMVGEGHILPIGDHEIVAIETPGHTPGCISYLVDDKVFTGDALFIRSTGRCDFQGGSASTLYHSIHKLFTLPDSTLVYPGHDYNGFTVSTIGEEKEFNSLIRLDFDEQTFVKKVDNLNLEPPKKIKTAVPANHSCGLIRN